MFSIGDRLQLTAPAQELGVANREVGTIVNIGAEKLIGLKTDDDRQVNIDPAKRIRILIMAMP